VNVSLVLPRGWNVGAPVALKFSGIAMNMPVQSDAALKLPAGNYKIAAQVFEKGDRASNVKPVNSVFPRAAPNYAHAALAETRAMRSTRIRHQCPAKSPRRLHHGGKRAGA